MIDKSFLALLILVSTCYAAVEKDLVHPIPVYFQIYRDTPKGFNRNCIQDIFKLHLQIEKFIMSFWNHPAKLVMYLLLFGSMEGQDAPP